MDEGVDGEGLHIITLKCCFPQGIFIDQRTREHLRLRLINVRTACITGEQTNFDGEQFNHVGNYTLPVLLISRLINRVNGNQSPTTQNRAPNER